MAHASSDPATATCGCVALHAPVRIIGGSGPPVLFCRSEHTLPVTALACGAGIANPLAVSAALDCHCHIRSIATGMALVLCLIHTVLHLDAQRSHAST